MIIGDRSGGRRWPGPCSPLVDDTARRDTPGAETGTGAGSRGSWVSRAPPGQARARSSSRRSCRGRERGARPRGARSTPARRHGRPTPTSVWSSAAAGVQPWFASGRASKDRRGRRGAPERGGRRGAGGRTAPAGGGAEVRGGREKGNGWEGAVGEKEGRERMTGGPTRGCWDEGKR
jgi:hypothetical protein